MNLERTFCPFPGQVYIVEPCLFAAIFRTQHDTTCSEFQSFRFGYTAAFVRLSLVFQALYINHCFLPGSMTVLGDKGVFGLRVSRTRCSTKSVMIEFLKHIYTICEWGFSVRRTVHTPYASGLRLAQGRPLYSSRYSTDQLLVTLIDQGKGCTPCPLQLRVVVLVNI